MNIDFVRGTLKEYNNMTLSHDAMMSSLMPPATFDSRLSQNRRGVRESRWCSGVHNGFHPINHGSTSEHVNPPRK